MGLDATVRCRCWENGTLTSPPPHGEHVRLDEMEQCVFLDLPWNAENREKHDAFEKWLASCCPHPQMEAAAEWISNWNGLRAFQSRLQELGLEKFPILSAVLPNANGGLVSPEQSRQALEELERFAQGHAGNKVVLADVETGEALQEYIAVYQGWFMCGPGGWEGGVDPEGFFIRGPSRTRGLLGKLGMIGGKSKDHVTVKDGLTITRPSNGVFSRLKRSLLKYAASGERFERFRSMRFHQEQLGPKLFRLRDDASGHEFVSPLGISRQVAWPDGKLQNAEGRCNFTYPKRFVVERRQRSKDEFEYILRPLRIVFAASVETGNPVHWC